MQRLLLHHCADHLAKQIPPATCPGRACDLAVTARLIDFSTDAISNCQDLSVGAIPSRLLTVACAFPQPPTTL
jgi:hypothetical protein